MLLRYYTAIPYFVLLVKKMATMNNSFFWLAEFKNLLWKCKSNWFV